MSFFLKGRGPTNIPEGQANQLFQAIAEAGVQAIQERENNFGRSRRGRRGMRMAGDMGDRRRSRLDEVRERERRPELNIGIGGGFGIPPRFPRGRREEEEVTTPGFPSDDNRRREVTTPGFPSDDNRPGIRPPVRMTKEEYDRMPKKGKRKFELPPGYEGLIDKFPIDDDRKRRRRRRREEEEVTTPGFPSKKRGSGAEAVNYNPRTREKDEMESRLRRKAEERSRRRRKRKGKKDLSEYDFTPQRPKYGKELIPKDKKRGRKTRKKEVTTPGFPSRGSMGDIGIGGGPGIPPRFPRGRRGRRVRDE